MHAPLQTAVIAGATLRYLDLGTGEPLMLLHGYPQSHRCWRFQAQELARTHRVIAPDWFGWGESQRSLALAPEYGAEVERIGLLGDALGLGSFNLAGHDYGGFLALGFCLRAPERVARLAILNSRAHRSFSPAFYRRTALQCWMARRSLPRALLAALPAYRLHRRELVRYVPRSFSDETLEHYIGWMRGAEGRRWLAHFFRHYDVHPRAELAAGLAGIDVPTAVIWGERDRYCPAAIAHELADRIPGAVLSLVATARHFVAEEAPEAVLEALRAWLARPAPLPAPQERRAGE